METRHNPENTDPLVSDDNPAIGCKVFSDPLRGSYNLAYRVLFDDGVEWILKVPASGSRARFDSLAAEALASEALTMKMIKRATTIPIPTIYKFDASLDNEIGCPYILMEFLKGRPLYEGWFDSGASSAKLEQFRARALQTVAAAMVQLNEFTLHRGGALRFNAVGEPVDIVGAKVPDINAYYDGVDENSCPDHDVWCAKGPTADPSDYFLFNLNRRGYQEGDSEYIRGVYESTCLFAKWALDLSQNMYPQGPQFVLAHPDLDLQNILVLEDGTLAGILDWDGVAAVPLSVGCLKLPNWLIRDWDPNNYNWDVEAHEPKLRSGRMENTPDELLAYRAMYAQFIEMLL
ncbi:kinase-like domain-containing protein, partial [Usnea florida]